MEGYNLLSVDCSDELQLLRVGGADRNNHSSGIAELGEQRGRQIGSSGGDEDGIERGVGGKTKSTVSGKDSGVVIAEFGENFARSLGQGGMAFDRENLLGKLSEQSGYIAGTRSNLENFVGAGELEGVEHETNNVWLRDGLVVTDGQRMVFIGLAAIRFRDKSMAGDAEHRIKDAWVGDAASPELGVDHELTSRGRVGHEFQLSGLGFQTPAGRLWSGDGLRSLFLLFAVADAHVEADHAILVTGADDRNVTIHIVLPLDDLL